MNAYRFGTPNNIYGHLSSEQAMHNLGAGGGQVDSCL